MRSLIVLIIGIVITSAQFFNTGNSAQPACLITGNKLFVHGNYIRDLESNDFLEITKYKREVMEFQKKLSEVFAPFNFLANNTKIPMIPLRPSLPTFCTSNETTLYILGSCTLQNHKIYVGGKFARELNDDEKAKLDEFVLQLSNDNRNDVVKYETNSTTSNVNIPKKKIVLDFCQEF